MEVINFEEYKIFEYIDSIFMVNEEIDIDSLKEKCNKVIDKIKNLPIKSKRKILLHLVSSLLVVASFKTVYNIIHSTKDPVAISVVDKKNNLFRDPLTMNITSDAIKSIKDFEKLKLKVYKLGDDKLTVGWGHAEDIDKTKLKKGQEIDIETAKKFFKEDIANANAGVKRMFDQWRQKGIDRKITQDQYNALVSMAFNMGITSFRECGFIQHIKHGDYKKAGEMITKTRISSKYPGLKKRREKESKMFLSYLGF